MRTLKLQMQISLDGFVTMEYGGTNFNWDNEVRSFSIENLTNVDNILLGRNTAEDFIPHWAGVASNPNHDDHKFGKLLTDFPKVVFSKKLKTSKCDNTTIVNGDIVEEIKNLKKKKGKGHYCLWWFFICIILNPTRTNRRILFTGKSHCCW